MPGHPMLYVSPRASPVRPTMACVFDEHFDYVWNTLRRLGVREGDIEDLAHEVFLKVHGRLGDFDPERPIRPWLFGFAYRVAADHRRLARHRHEVFGSPFEAIDPMKPVDERIAATEDREVLQAALESLDIHKRAVLVLHDVEDVSVPTLAASLGIPLNTAYSRLRLARAELAATVKRLRGKGRRIVARGLP